MPTHDAMNKPTLALLHSKKNLSVTGLRTKAWDLFFLFYAPMCKSMSCNWIKHLSSIKLHVDTGRAEQAYFIFLALSTVSWWRGGRSLYIHIRERFTFSICSRQLSLHSRYLNKTRQLISIYEQAANMWAERGTRGNVRWIKCLQGLLSRRIRLNDASIVWKSTFIITGKL